MPKPTSTPVSRFAARVAGAVALLAVAGCGGPSPTGPSNASTDGGVRLQAEVLPGPEGSLEVHYEVTNDGSEPVVVTDGVPAQDTTLLPEAAPDAAYVRLRAGGTVEVSRRTFGAPALTERSESVLMRGTRLPPGQSLTGTVRLQTPPHLYRPYDGADQDLTVPDAASHVTFCLGVVDEADIEPSLQGLAEDDQPVLRHPTRQLVLCSPEVDLPY